MIHLFLYHFHNIKSKLHECSLYNGIWRQVQEIYPNPDLPEDTVNQTRSTYTYSNDTI